MFKEHAFISYLTKFCDKQLSEYDIDETFRHINGLIAAKAALDITDLLNAIKKGEKIEAIKAYRSLTNMGLKESKDAVEKYIAQPVANV